MINYPEKAVYTYDDLVDILRILRAPGGCPWDREQTHESNRRNFLEEAYEAAEAFDLDAVFLIHYFFLLCSRTVGTFRACDCFLRAPVRARIYFLRIYAF